MSISVDDLVASLSGSHIGQEAIDLAALQTQLAQTLFTHQLSGSPHIQTKRDPNSIQPCNTPTGRTPSSSFSWPSTTFATEPSWQNTRRSSITLGRSRRTSVDEGSYNSYTRSDADDMDEESMVEDILTEPAQASMSKPGSFSTAMNVNGYAVSYTPMYTPCGGESLFTSQDPFYIAQVQAAQNANSPSFFAHTGRPSVHSPFVAQRWDHPQPVHIHTSPFER